MKRKLIIGFLILTLIAVPLFAAACEEEPTPPGEEEEGPPGEEEEEEEEGNWWDEFGEPQYGGTITVRVASMSSVMDVWLHRPGDLTMWFENLASWDWTLDRNIWPFNVMYVPPEYLKGFLAESWEQPDPQTLILHIREGVYWQDKPPVNGREFTAYDVEHHFHRILGIGSGYTEPSPTAVSFLSYVASVTATDNYTVNIQFKEPGILALLQVLSDAPPSYIEAPEAVEAEGGSLTDWTKAVGTGAWILTDFVSNSSMTLTKNPNYWGYDERHPENRLPYADTLKFALIPDLATALAALRTAQTDIMYDIPWQQAESLAETNPELEMEKMPALTGLGLQMRCDTAPFTDIRVRKALQMAIDRETIAETYYGGIVEGIPAGIVNPAYKGYCFAYEDWPQELKDEYSYNPEKARELLAEAAADGVFEPNELGGFDTNVVAGTTHDLQLLQLIQSEFLDIGVDMDIRVMDPPTLTAFCQAGSHDQMAAYATTQIFPLHVMIALYDSRQITTNYTRNMDPTYDALVDKLAAALDSADAARAMIEADKYSLEKHWSVQTIPSFTYTAYQPYLKGYSGEILSWNAWFFYARLWIDQDIKESTGS